MRQGLLRFSTFALFAALAGCTEFDAQDGHTDEFDDLLVGEEQDLAGTVSFLSVADARVIAATPSSNFGTATKLYVDNSPMERSYLRFNVANVTDMITRAQLRLFVTNGSANGPAAYLTSNSWSETGINWSNRPAPIGSALADLGSVSSGTWVMLDVSAAVKGNGTFSFVLVGTSSDGVDFYSREGTSKPSLVLTTQSTVCTPTTCAGQRKNCGSLSDGCGGTLECGSCTAPQTCGGGGVANVCGSGTPCTPTTCAAQGKNCGSISDGCGGTLSCGSCTAPQTCGGAGVANVCGATPPGGTAPPANFKLAVIGDTGVGSNFTSVLNLVKSEAPDALLVAGDMGYSSSVSSWFTALDSVLGADFPVFAAEGNHDASQGWTNYSNVFVPRWQKAGAAVEQTNMADGVFNITYKGLYMVMVGQSGANTTYADYVKTKLAADKHVWRICAWHKNQNAMQIGGKGDEMGWGVYENCRIQGAIIATGHEHSYERTKTLTNMTAQTVDGTCNNPKSVCVGPNRTFAFVSGLGGNSIRDQQRCLPATAPYGCKGEWASIYSTTQAAKYGALFLTFNVGGNPKKAQGVFKSTAGTVIDEFVITKD